MSIGLSLERQQGETWLKAAIRVAAVYKLEAEVKEAYLQHRRDGMDCGRAAWAACCDWDVLVFTKEAPKR